MSSKIAISLTVVFAAFARSDDEMALGSRIAAIGTALANVPQAKVLADVNRATAARDSRGQLRW